MSADSRAVMQGRIDVTPDAPWARDVRLDAVVAAGAQAGWHRCEAPGLVLHWDGRRATHAAAADALCIAWGAPALSSTPAQGVAPRVDAHAILARWRREGTGALAALHGAYGLLIADARLRQVVLAVDRFSMETVCFAQDGAAVAVSDRADEVPFPHRVLSRQALYDYLYFHCIPAPLTVYRDVRRLEAGTHLVARDGSLRIDRHWQPLFHAALTNDARALGSEFRALLRAAVTREASAGEQLGCFLSGGTDSSTVAGMLAGAAAAPVRTYSIGFDATGYDEMAYARIAAQHFGTEHHEYYVTADDVAAEVPALARSFDQPFGNSSALPTYFCARMAKADGVTRMLAGDGGDELFGGNTRYRLQLVLGLYEHLPRALRASVLEPLLARAPAVPGLRHAAAYVRHASTAMPDRLETFNLLTRVGAANVLAPAVLAGVDQGAPRAAQRESYARSRAPDLLDRILQYEWKYTLADSDLPKVRGATALAGVRVGYPLLADEIVDLSLRLPARWKVRRLQLRWFFKDALRGFLPPAIIAKKKHGFGLPFGVWATRHARVRDLAADSLAGLERRGVLRPGFRDPLMSELMPAHPAYYGELIWILMMLEQWIAGHATGASLEL